MKSHTIILLISIFSLGFLNAQVKDTIFFDSNWKKLPTSR